MHVIIQIIGCNEVHVLQSEVQNPLLSVTTMWVLSFSVTVGSDIKRLWGFPKFSWPVQNHNVYKSQDSFLMAEGLIIMTTNTGDD